MYKCSACGSEAEELKKCCNVDMEKKCEGCGNLENQCSCGK